MYNIYNSEKTGTTENEGKKQMRGKLSFLTFLLSCSFLYILFKTQLSLNEQVRRRFFKCCPHKC